MRVYLIFKSISSSYDLRSYIQVFCSFMPLNNRVFTTLRMSDRVCLFNEVIDIMGKTQVEEIGDIFSQIIFTAYLVVKTQLTYN